jgi:hypothetical protein
MPNLPEVLPMRDFSKATIRALAAKGVRITGLQAIPDMTSSMPFANASRGYIVDDNGCGRIWTFAEVLEAAR